MEKILCCGPYEILVCAEDKFETTVYLPLSLEDGKEVWRRLKGPKPVLAAISGVDWNRELSPWPAPKVFRGGEDFGGEAAGFLNVLIREIAPAVKESLGTVSAYKAIAGYSLAGLFAFWALYQTSFFSRAASISGSLWYDGFSEYLETGAFPTNPAAVYLSLGDREKLTKNQRMSRVEECTLKAAKTLEGAGVQVAFEQNPGGHFQDTTGRIARGIDRMLVL